MCDYNIRTSPTDIWCFDIKYVTEKSVSTDDYNIRHLQIFGVTI